MTYLNITESDLQTLGAFWTAKEIEQQPDSWQKTQVILTAEEDAIAAFLSPILSIPDLRIILTGAGTSAFVGECLKPILLKSSGKRIEAIATTDLVSGPKEFFQRDVPTLLVSFGRSGNSPESVAAVKLSEQCITQCYQLVITCNQGGELYERCKTQSNSHAILLPEETHDRSFAMTSSFTSMMYTALTVLSGDKQASRLKAIATSAASVVAEHNSSLKDLADEKFERVVYLGSNGHCGLAREASLKLLELTDGQTVAVYDSPLGFRHGPKTIVNDKTLVFVFVSNDPYTRKFDLDLLAEVRRDGEAGKVLAITAMSDGNVTDGDYILVDHGKDVDDAALLFPYIVCAQIYAFHSALAFGNKPDTPSASGTVNRVVQGVTLYDL